jgi:hypothetical protein
MTPKSFDGSGISAMCEQEPETKDRLSKDVQDGVSNDLSIDTPLASTITDTPDNWVQGPENEGEAADGSKELGGGAALAHDCTATRDDKLVDDDEVSNAGNCIPSPLLTIVLAESGKEASQNHDDVCNESNEDASTVHACQESQVEEEKWCSDAPVNISGPEYLTEDMLDSVGNVLVCLLDNDVCVRISVTGGHGEVGDGSEGGDHSGDDMEEAFLLVVVSCVSAADGRWDLRLELSMTWRQTQELTES